MKSLNEEELKQVHAAYNLKINGFIEEAAERQKVIVSLRDEIANLQMRNKENLVAAEKREETLIQDYLKKIEETRLAGKRELNDMLAKVRGESDNFIRMIEQRNENERTELVAGHKKQVDDLRAFFSSSTIQLKKVSIDISFLY